MQPLLPFMPNVRRWREQGGCGPQVCHPSVEAAGNEQAQVPRILGVGEPGKVLACWCCHGDLSQRSLDHKLIIFLMGTGLAVLTWAG